MGYKILLLDTNGVKIGETFQRRARQLVNQQRAEWVDESHRAIRFAPDVEEWKNEVVPQVTIMADLKEDEQIYAFAQKRLHERKMFLLHSFAFIPGILIINFIAETLYIWSWGFACFLSGAWTMAYAIHLFFFIKANLRDFRWVAWEEHQARKLSNEVNRLKRMGITYKA